MKPTTIATGKVVAIAALGLISLALVSWDFRQQPSRLTTSEVTTTDTIPGKSADKRERPARDLDEAIEQLDKVDMDREMSRAMKEVEQAMKNLDFSKIQKEVSESLASINLDKIQEDVKQALKEVDMAKIKADIDREMSKVDMVKIQEEVKAALKDIDMEKIKAELSKADMEELKKDLAELKDMKLDLKMKELQDELKNIGPDVRKSLEEAKVSIEKAKADLKLYKELVDGLDNDGLLNKKEPYTIRHKDGKLLINDKEASAETYKKYKNILDKKKEFLLKKTADNFNIDDDNID